MFTGEKVAPFKTVSVDQASWFLTHGEGLGKSQYRCNIFDSLALCKIFVVKLKSMLLDYKLSLFFSFHKKKNNNKNPHQNLLEESVPTTGLRPVIWPLD